MRPITVKCLPVGRDWDISAREQFNSLLAQLPGWVVVDVADPVLHEMDVLRQVESVLGGKADLLLLAAIHGGSARALTLAAVKYGLPVAIWCHDEKHSLASSALAREALRQLGHPAVLLHGQEAGTNLTSAAGGAAARIRLSKARIGHLGPTHFNLVSAQTNPLTIIARFGAWVVPISISSLRSVIRSIEPEEVEAAVKSIGQTYTLLVDGDTLRMAVSMHLALARIAREQGLDSIAVDCWNEIVPEFGVSPCFGFARDDYRIACEGDLILAVTMIVGEAIHGMPGYVGDLYSFDEMTNIITLTHCAGCASLHSGPGALEIARQSPPGPAGQSGAVVACRPVLPSGQGTMALLHGESLDLLHLRRCEILSTEFSDQMKVSVRIEGDSSGFLAEVSGNHYVIFPGDCRDAWHIWAEWSGIKTQEVGNGS